MRYTLKFKMVQKTWTRNLVTRKMMIFFTKSASMYKKNDENKFAQNAKKNYLVHLQSISQNNTNLTKRTRKVNKIDL